MEKLYASTLRNSFEPGAHLRVASRAGKESSRQRAVIKAGAADDNRPAPPAVNALDCGHGISDVPRRCVLFGRIGDIDDVVRNAAALIERNLVGADIKPAVNGGGIAADDFAAPPDRQLDAERAFACGSRAEDGKDRRPQTLHPEKSQDHGGAEKDQQAELLRAGREGHRLTGNLRGPRCRGTSP